MKIIKDKKMNFISLNYLLKMKYLCVSLNLLNQIIHKIGIYQMPIYYEII